jgi:long-chain fatty acid transport protein
MSFLQKPRALIIAFMFTFSSAVLASGFQINEHDAKATGMGGAFVAQSNDGSAIFFNPAGLAFQRGTGLLGGATLIAPATTYTDPNGSETKMDKQVFFPPNLYGTYEATNNLVAGIGIFSPYGLGIEWPSDWPGRYLAVKATIESFYFNPSVSYKMNDQLSIGLGVSYVYSSLSLSYNIPTFTDENESQISSEDGSVKLTGTGSGFNFDAGVLYKPLPSLSFGASYRHSTKIDYSGTAAFSNMQGLSNYFPGGDGSTTITLPSIVFAGVAFSPDPAFTLEADYQFTGWSSYDKLSVTLTEGPPDPKEGNRVLQTSQVQVKDWNDAYLLRFGGEYRYQQYSFRAGYVFDTTPQPDKTVEPLLPDANRNDFTLGIGYRLSDNVSLDAVYMIVLFNDRSVTAAVNPFPGTYQSNANLVGIDVGYKF